MAIRILSVLMHGETKLRWSPLLVELTTSTHPTGLKVDIVRHEAVHSVVVFSLAAVDGSQLADAERAELENWTKNRLADELVGLKVQFET